MAELLVFLGNNTNADPVKEARGCWKRGDVVVVRENGVSWGAEEGWPKFGRVRISDVTVNQVLKYLEAEPSGLFDAQGNPITLTRRRYRLRVDHVPVGIRQAVANNELVIVTRAQIINFIRNKLTNVDET